jgi:ubiquinone/menaquinone biosynthesis C-methylase UbiE
MIADASEEISRAWNAIAPGYDRFVTSSHMAGAEEGLRRAGLQPGMRFLDVAAGSGALSIPAARLGARVLSTDLSAVMLVRLKERARREAREVETRIMDGHALALESGSFDMAGSQFGVMLFPDMPRGVRELARVTRPAGRVLMNVLGDVRRVEFFAFFVSAIQAVVPGFSPPMDPPPLPFQLQDPERLRRELNAAGLRDVEVETYTERLEFDTGDQLWDWLLNSNPVAGAVVAGLKASGEQLAAIRQALERLVRERAGGSGRAILTVPVHIGVGTK